jgi:hypothetical protein
MDDASILHFIRFPVFCFGAKKVHLFKELFSYFFRNFRNMVARI